MQDTTKVTRFEVIDHRQSRTSASDSARALVVYGAKVELSFQDYNRTLKVFLSDPS